MTRKERKAYKQGKADGYVLGYTQGLHDGNPFIMIAEAAADFANKIADTFTDPEVLKALEKVKEIQEEES